MADEDKKTTDDQTDQDGDKKPPVNWEEWLKGQPDEIRAAYEDHTKGLKTALGSERERADRLEKEQKAKAKADADAAADRLKQQGEYKTLAEQAEAKVAELEKRVADLTPASERLTAYETALQGYLAKEREGLPAHILALLDSLDVVKQLEYIANNRQALKPQTSGGTIPPTPSPGSAPGKLSDEERRKRAWTPRL